MRQWRQAAVGLAVMAVLLTSGSGCVLAEGRAVPPPPAPADVLQPAPKPDLDDQAAQSLLERYQRDKIVQEDQKRFAAEQHFQTGKAHFEMMGWAAARRQFLKALELNPNHAEAMDYLKKANGLLSVRQGSPASMLGVMAGERQVALEMHKMEIRNLFEEARHLYEQGHYREAIDRFQRVQVQAKYLAPILNASKVMEEAAVGERKARDALERQRQEQQREKMRKAIEESRQLREERRSQVEQQTGALLAQANALYEQERFDQARSVCDEVLRRDPASGPALALRDKAAGARREADLARTLHNQHQAVDQHMREVMSWTVPQAELVSMPPELFDEVKNRRASTYFLGKPKEPEAWEQRIRETLTTQRVTFDFIETPLPDVLAFLSSLTDVSIILDHDSVKDNNPAITLRVRDMSLERALNWICKLAGLKYTLKNEALYVAKPDKLYDQEVLRIYDVSDLTMEIKHFKGRQRALATDGGVGQEESRIGEEFWGDFDEDDEKEEPLTGEKLIEFIRRVIGPGTWDEETARGFIGEPFSVIPRDAHRDRTTLSGQELVDILALTVGSRTYVGVRTKE